MTNPAIDPFREAVVTSLRCFVGPEEDMTAVLGPQHCARLELPQPVLSIAEMEALKAVNHPGGWKTKVSWGVAARGRERGPLQPVPALLRGRCGGGSRTLQGLMGQPACVAARSAGRPARLSTPPASACTALGPDLLTTGGGSPAVAVVAR